MLTELKNIGSKTAKQWAQSAEANVNAVMAAVQQVRTAEKLADITDAKIQAITDAVQTAKTQIQTAQKIAE